MIPASFKIFAHTWRVKFEDLSDAEEEGICDFNDRVIIIDSTQEEEKQLLIFFHEIMHAWLKELNHELTEDERFVDNLAQCFYQFIMTAKGGKKK